MQHQVFTILQNIRKRHKQYGKIYQGLLALAFEKMNFKVLDNNFSEGTDILIQSSKSNTKYAVEVKTAEDRNEVHLEEKDIRGWLDKRGDSYFPVLAVLPLNSTEEWILCEAGTLIVGAYPPSVLKARYKQVHFQDEVNTSFPSVVIEHGEACIEGGLRYLSSLFQGLGH